MLLMVDVIVDVIGMDEVVDDVVMVVAEYGFKRFGPPQYSVELPSQVIEQLFRAGSLPPEAIVDPALK